MARSFLRRWIDSLTEEAKLEVEATLYRIVLYAAAFLASLGVVILLAMALYWYLEDQLGPITAALLEAGGFAVIAAAFAIWAAQPRAVSPAPARAGDDQTRPRQGDGGRKSAAAETMGVDLEEIGRTLSAAGYRVEGLAVMASSEFMRQLTPLQFVSLVFVASFLFGRRLRRG